MMDRHRWLRVGAPIVGRTPWLFYPLAAAAARVGWHVRPEWRRNLTANMLPLCDGDRARATAEAQRACRNLGRYWVDVTTVPYRKFETFERDHIRFVNEERLDVLCRPGPVMIVSAHTAGAELALQATSGRGRRFTALVEEIEPPEMAEYLNRLRSSAGGCFRGASLGGLRAALEALRRGEVVGIMADRDLHGTGVCAVLAGNAVRLPRGPWELARRTGATILPMFASRDWRDNFVVHVEEPFHVSCDVDEDLAVAEAARRFAVILEVQLRREPGQWTVIEDFWRVHRCGES